MFEKSNVTADTRSADSGFFAYLWSNMATVTSQGSRIAGNGDLSLPSQISSVCGPL